MPRFRIVIDDPDVAHAQEIARHVAANLGKGYPRAVIEREIRRVVGPPRAAGTVHDIAEATCPFDRPNCRNCGDPDHAATCRAAGHCPDCGTKHGIAPDAVVARNGYRLEPL